MVIGCRDCTMLQAMLLLCAHIIAVIVTLILASVQVCYDDP